MKRPKCKRFKRHIDLIRYSVGRAIYHQDVEIPARMKMISDDYFLRHSPDFLQEAGRKLKGLR